MLFTSILEKHKLAILVSEQYFKLESKGWNFSEFINGLSIFMNFYLDPKASIIKESGWKLH